MSGLPHIALSGMMGTGKSTIGALLARWQGWPFVDLDARIEASAGASVTDIFRDKGEVIFRRLEHDALRAALDAPASVLALGGGVVTNLRNREIMRGRARVITLTASPEALLLRVGPEGVAARPLLARLPDDGARLQKLREMTVMRARAYSAADALIDTDGATPEAVAERIMGQLWAWGIPREGGA